MHLHYRQYDIITRLIFFFKQQTAYEITTGDWSSDVCSSDLGRGDEDHSWLTATTRPIPSRSSATSSSPAPPIGSRSIAATSSRCWERGWWSRSRGRPLW